MCSRGALARRTADATLVPFAREVAGAVPNEQGEIGMTYDAQGRKGDVTTSQPEREEKWVERREDYALRFVPKQQAPDEPTPIKIEDRRR
jgi:hypothetical protein